MESIEGGKHPTTTNIALSTCFMPGLATQLKKESTISKCNLEPRYNRCCEVCNCKCNCVIGDIAAHHQTLECVGTCICKPNREEYLYVQEGMLCYNIFSA